MKQRANYPSADLPDKLRGLFSRDAGLIGSVVQKSAIYFDYQKQPQPAITLVEVLERLAPPPEPNFADYEGILRLHQEVLTPSAFLLRVASLSKGQLVIGSETFQLQQSNYNVTESDLPGKNDYGSWPGKFFEIGFSSVQLPMNDLLHAELPPYTSPGAAIRAFMKLKGLDDRDGRLGHFLIYFPNFNARILGLDLRKRLLTVHLALNATVPLDSVLLKINYIDDQRQELQTTIKPVTLDPCVALKSQPKELNVWLLSQKGELIDYCHENAYYSQGVSRVLPKAKQLTAPIFELGEGSSIDLPFQSVPAKVRKNVPRTRTNPKYGKKVFVIHGHSKGPKEAVARFLTAVGLKPVILHEKPNNGRTIMEKFERHSKVGFAIAILTADDVGKSRRKRVVSLRARQNVIFEFGFFIGKLARGRVCALKEEKVEAPSDYDGVLYIPLDEQDQWKASLAKELKSAGYKINLNRVL